MVGRSGHRHDDGVPTGGAVRERLGACVRSGSRRWRPSRGPRCVWFPAEGVPFEDPLAPGVDGVDGRRAGPPAMAPPSTRTSTRSMPRCCAQATPAMATLPAATRANGLGVSIRDIVLIGLPSPSRARPSTGRRRRSGQLELDQPLGGRDVAVQAGHDHPDRVAVDGRQRLAVHRRRPASRRDRRGRPRSGCRSTCRRSSGETIWSAPAWTPACSRTVASGTPIQRAFPTYSPPTSLETHVRVMSRSIVG